ncbi:MAG: amino acid adenylation domain-containing protein [Elusimicrobia bacterium]|nr:amino acid adenylation domain-containing protein [Elusimicrobiota bacterium]
MGTLAGCLDRAFREHPDLPAVSCRGRTLTYRELHAEAASIAAALRKAGVGPGHRVGLYLHRSISAVAAAHACLMLGAAYVPIDPQNPWARVLGLLEDCGASTLAAESRLLPRGRSRAGRLRVLAVDRVPVSRRSSAPLRRAKSSDQAYILYTSGSTGKPKGVLMADRNAMAFVEWAVSEFRLRSSDRLANLAPFQFDLSIFDIFSSASACASLHIIPYPDSLFPAKVGRFLVRERTTAFYTVPSVLSSISALETFRPGAFPDLRLLLFAGEVLPPRVLAAWQELAPNAVFYNLYGPTETNVCLFHRVRRPYPAQGPAIPIGRPLPGTSVRVVADGGARCRPGGRGELLVKGPTVMLGYANGEGGPGEGGFYRTGDIVSLAKDGAYRFWGRRDDQVKVRGCRVDLKEVEAALNSLPGIAVSAVTPVGEGERRSLTAHVAAKPGSRVTEAGVVKALALVLPSYMLPSKVAVLPDLPRLATGKLDRRSLGGPSSAGLAIPAVRKILEEKILRGRSLGDDESFWDGGALDSLDLLQFVHQLEKAFGLRIPETDVNPEVFASLRSVSDYLAKKVQ